LIILFINSVHWKLNMYSHSLNINMNKLTNSQLLIDAIRQKYPDNIGQYFFKSCGKEWIVVMEKVGDSITNRSRLPFNNPNIQFAKYRANKLMVVDIIYKFNLNQTINEIYNSCYKNHIIKYIKGNIVTSDSFDKNTNEVCSNGIHFYETIDCAFYFELMRVENGKWTEWYDDGQKKEEGEYLNGKENGKWTYWYDNGQKRKETEYINGKQNGKWTFWYQNGEKYSEGEYVNGEENCKWTIWYKNGQKKKEGEYVNGEKNGKWTIWHENGQIEEGEYLNGEKHGKWISWYNNGQKCSEGEYLNGEQNGNWTYWYYNGQIQSETEYLTETEYLNGEKHIKLTK